jgi:hypothetical protein
MRVTVCLPTGGAVNVRRVLETHRPEVVRALDVYHDIEPFEADEACERLLADLRKGDTLRLSTGVEQLVLEETIEYLADAGA